MLLPSPRSQESGQALSWSPNAQYSWSSTPPAAFDLRVRVFFASPLPQIEAFPRAKPPIVTRFRTPLASQSVLFRRLHIPGSWLSWQDLRRLPNTSNKLPSIESISITLSTPPFGSCPCQLPPPVCATLVLLIVGLDPVDPSDLGTPRKPLGKEASLRHSLDFAHSVLRP